MTDRKKEILAALEKMIQKEKMDKQPFKVRAYKKVLDQIKALNQPITKYEDVAEVQGIGKSIKEKIEEILATGRLAAANAYNARPEVKGFNDLNNVYGIGPAKAKALMKDHGIYTIEDLRARSELLNDKQLIGLKHYEDFKERIPRAEMDKHAEFLLKLLHAIDPRYVGEITGSYRRGAKDSGDIDFLITHPDDTLDHDANFKRLIEEAQKAKYLTDILAQGPKKCLGVCRAKRYKIFRRIDFMLTSKHEFPFALLYFTGSQGFNIQMRNVALSKGYSLSEYGLKCLRGDRKGDFVTTEFTTEREVFDFLNMAYVAPTDRNM